MCRIAEHLHFASKMPQITLPIDYINDMIRDIGNLSNVKVFEMHFIRFFHIDNRWEYMLFYFPFELDQIKWINALFVLIERPCSDKFIRGKWLARKCRCHSWKNRGKEWKKKNKHATRWINEKGCTKSLRLSQSIMSGFSESGLKKKLHGCSFFPPWIWFNQSIQYGYFHLI